MTDNLHAHWLILGRCKKGCTHYYCRYCGERITKDIEHADMPITR